VWNDLIPHLTREHNLQRPTLEFLHLMHLERRIVDLSDGEGDANLFHGHVLALHPATGLLMQSQTGRRLMGAYLSAEEAEEREVPFQQLLRAIYLSLYFYSDRRQTNRRVKQPRNAGQGRSEDFQTRRSPKRRRRDADGDDD
jgi:hypothetical protein